MRKTMLFPLLVCFACSPSQGTPDEPVQVSPKVDDPSAPPPSIDPGPLDMAQADVTCGGEQFTVERLQPNVMFVLDRSGSMGEPIMAGSATSKWQDLKASIQSLVGAFNAQMRLGVTLYPDLSNDTCGQGVVTPYAAMNGTTVLQKLGAQGPGGNTPTATTLKRVRNQGMLNDPTRDNVVVLATDGLPNCTGNVKDEIEDLYQMTPPVKTYVIGVGADVSSQVNLLNSWADAGHTARTGATKFYPTSSPTELQQAFDTIAAGLVSCSFHLTQAAPDPSQLFVWLSGAPVANDATDGYTHDATANTVTLNGQSCEALKASATASVQVVYGCPTPPPPPPIQ